MLFEKQKTERNLVKILICLALTIALSTVTAFATQVSTSPTVTEAPTAEASPSATPSVTDEPSESPVAVGYGWALDILVAAFLVLMALYGIYKGFLTSVLNLAGSVLSWLLALLFYPSLSSLLASNTSLIDTMLYYTEGSSNINDVELLSRPVSGMETESIIGIIENAQLPEPLGSLLQNNILNQAFSGTDITTLGQYFDYTLAHIMLNIISFLIIFLAVKLIVAIAIKVGDIIMRLPVLKQFNRIFGAAAGLLRGVVICYLVFSLVPILLTIVPNAVLTATFNNSFFSTIFYKGNIISNVISGFIG